MTLSERIERGPDRIGSHAQPCKLVWCKRPQCRREPEPEAPRKARWLRNPELAGKVLA